MRAPTTQELRIYLLGRFEVWRDGALVSAQAWARRKNQTLLTILASERGRLFTNEQLIEILYPDLSPDRAARNVHNRIGELRRFLEPNLKHSKDSIYFHHLRSHGYAFNKDAPCWIDIEVFQAQLKQARDAEKKQAWPEAIRHYEESIALYRGEYLSEDIYEDWSASLRQELQEKYLSALAGLAESYARRGEYATALEQVQKALHIAPSRENFYRQKMLYHSILGETGEALKTYQNCISALKSHLDVPVSAETEKLHQQILAQDQPAGLEAYPIPTTKTARLNNLAPSLSSFVGRKNELKELRKLLEKTRLLTLVGFGGVGKTRLALELGQDMYDEFPQGVWFVDLASLTSAELILPRIASAMGLSAAQQKASLEKIIQALKSRKILLILDNCEHLIRACAEFAEKCLSECPQLKILTTSREVLNLPGEFIWPVPPLASPKETSTAHDPQGLLEFDAVRLLVERTRSRQIHFAVTKHNASALITLCNRLEGVPLAIEIAAASLRALSIEELLQRLEDRFARMTAANRSAPLRQQTLQSTMDWSYELLTELERRILQKLSVFQGGFSLEAAEAVCEEETQNASEMLATLMSLVDKSLVMLTKQSEGAGRYRILEVVRQYAFAKLESAIEENEVRDRHLDYFFELARTANKRLQGAEQKNWIARLREEVNNLDTACRWAKARDTKRALELSVLLSPFWDLECYWKEGREWLEALLDEAGEISPDLRADALSWAGFFECRTACLGEDYVRAGNLIGQALALARQSQNAQSIICALLMTSELEWRRGIYQAAYEYAQEAYELSKKNKAEYYVAASLKILGVMSFYLKNYAESELWFCKSLDAFRQMAHEQGIADVLGDLARIERQRSNYQKAIRLYEESVSILQKNGANKTDLARLHKGIADIHRVMGEYDEALAHLKYSLQIWQEVKSHFGLVYGLECFAKIACRQNQLALALHIWSACENWRAQQAAPLPAVELEEYEEHLKLARSQLTPSEFCARWGEGRRLTLHEAARQALHAISDQHIETFSVT